MHALNKTLEQLSKILVGVAMSIAAVNVMAAETAAAIEDEAPTVEQNILAMDKDHNGIVTVYEVRAFIEAKHGKGYKKDILDDMEASAGGKSCGTSFAKPLY